MGVERCDGCRFWRKGEAPSETYQHTGDCRRYAPRAKVGLGDEEPFCYVDWPQLFPEDWCGEWQAKVVELTAEQRRELAAGHIVNLG